MRNLIIVALEDQATTAHARGLLADAMGEDLVVLDNANAVGLGVSRSVGMTDSRLHGRVWRTPLTEEQATQFDASLSGLSPESRG